MQADAVSGQPLHFGSSTQAAGWRGPAVALSSAGLVVRAVVDRDMVFLEAYHPSDPTRSFLLALTHRPVVEGISSFSPLGRWHARCWGLAFGVGSLPPDAHVRFESGTLRYATAAVCAVPRLPLDCWVADAEGVFRSAVLVVHDQERARTRLAPGP